MAKEKDASDGTSSGNSGSSESSGYVLSPSNPADVVVALGALGARLIGSQVVGSLRFESVEHERSFLCEAGDSFCFPLMERRLMRTGAGHALHVTP